MATIAGITDQTNVALAEKLLEAGWAAQKVGAENVSNWLTKDYKAQKVSGDFYTQMQSLAKNQDAAGIKALLIETQVDSTAPVDENGNSVNLEREMQSLKSNSLNQEFLTKVAANFYSQFDEAITGNT